MLGKEMMPAWDTLGHLEFGWKGNTGTDNHWAQAWDGHFIRMVRNGHFLSWFVWRTKTVAATCQVSCEMYDPMEMWNHVRQFTYAKGQVVWLGIEGICGVTYLEIAAGMLQSLPMALASSSRGLLKTS